MKRTLAITRKELESYFGSPMALIFIGTFLAATLFAFFWAETFFARGVADVRPLFNRMPLLMVFLVAALTMRQWSEEQRSGTLEVLLTLPVSPLELVLGKFLAVVALVAVALGLTLYLPITVSLLGNLDWGPVVGGYLAAILLAAAYTAIGLFLSSRTDNQIVALIATVLVCGLSYLIGSTAVTSFAGQGLGDLLRALGAGSRFESIERGVVDLRDLLYYLTLSGLFLALNVLSLKAKGWSEGEQARSHRLSTSLTSALLAANLLFVNVWAYPLSGLRLDLTENHLYTLSAPTKEVLSQLQEPLTIRGYFSEKTHPLLAPLVPQVRDMLREYEVAAGGGLNLEIIDPADYPEKEAEANQVYGIQPSPFQVADRYETFIVNAYFQVLIQYGDQSEVLTFEDLISVESRADGTVDVRLGNLEYDLTRSIRKVVYGFQSTEAMLASLQAPAELTLYYTSGSLPDWLQGAPETLRSVSKQLVQQSNGNYSYRAVDLEDPETDVTPDSLYEQYGLRPIAVSIFSNDSYYFHPVLTVGDQAQLVSLPDDVAEANVRSALESALQRYASGFLQVVGLWTPPSTPTQDMYGQTQQPLSSWERLRQALAQEYEVRSVSLDSGQVSGDVDVLVLVAPQELSDKARYAVDQYLMRGGSVVVAASKYKLGVDQFQGGLALQPISGGVDDLLANYGVTVQDGLVMDPQNGPFPVVVNRQVGQMQLQEIQAIDYPYFVDVRSDGMAKDSPLVSNLSALTLNWTSPITVADTLVEGEATVLLRSSEAAWLQEGTGTSEGDPAGSLTGGPSIQPDFETYPDYGFAQGEERRSYPLAVALQGSFESAWRDKEPPFGENGQGAGASEGVQEDEVIPPSIAFSPASAQLLVVGSAEFLDDVVYQLSANLGSESYLNGLNFMQNAVAWASEDTDLLEIRARGRASRVLAPLTEKQQSFWETLNYVLALASLAVLGLVISVRRRNVEPMELLPPDQVAGYGDAGMREEVSK